MCQNVKVSKRILWKEKDTLQQQANSKGQPASPKRKSCYIESRYSKRRQAHKGMGTCAKCIIFRLKKGGRHRALILFSSFIREKRRAGKMAVQERALAAEPSDLSSEMERTWWKEMTESYERPLTSASSLLLTTHRYTCTNTYAHTLMYTHAHTGMHMYAHTHASTHTINKKN